VIVLVDIGDFSYADAAQILDIPVGTVMSRLHRGRRILKGALAETALEEGRNMSYIDPCAHCEEMMQPYLDHVLTDEERVEAESHLDECELCRRRYRFEREPEGLRPSGDRGADDGGAPAEAIDAQD
jgi:hypothetical protein